MKPMEATARKGEAIDLAMGPLGADTKEIGQPSFVFSIHLFFQFQREGREISLCVGNL